MIASRTAGWGRVARRGGVGWWLLLTGLGALAATSATLAAAAPVSLGPAVQIETWDTEDGLPHNSVTCVLQSSQGYLWLGTHNGLVRTDGIQFKIHSLEADTNMPGNRVLCLFEDGRRRLWFGVEGGGAGVLVDGRVRRAPVPGLAETSVTAIAQNTAGDLLFATVRGEIIQWNDRRLQVFSAAEGLPGGPITGLVVDRDNRVWAATANWLGRLVEGRFQEEARDSSDGLVIGLRRAGGLWVILGNRLRPWPPPATPQGWALPAVAEKPLHALSVLENRKGEVWVGLNGAGLLRLRNDQFESVGEPPPGAGIVLALAEDEEGNLWAGTRGSGLLRFRQRMFEVINTERGLTENSVRTICESASGGVWLGTDGGGMHRLESDGRVTRLHSLHGLPPEPVNAVLEDRHGTVWAGTWGAGLFQMSGPQPRPTQPDDQAKFQQRSEATARFEPFRPPPGFQPRFIRALYEAEDGTLWIGTLLDGVFAYDGRTLRSYSPTNGLSHADVRAILQDQAGAMWFGTGGGGLTRLHNGRLRVFTTAQGLPSDFVRVLFQDREKTLWVGTDGGLACRKSGEFQALTTANALPDTVISHVFKDERGRLWLGGNRGIFQAPARELAAAAGQPAARVNFVSYTKADGLSGGECTSGAQPGACRTRDGRLLFPTLQGVTVADPKNLRANPRPPRVLIEAVLADGLALPATSPVVVPAGCQRLEVHYAGLSLTAPRRVRFRHRLTGMEEVWHGAEGRRSAVYPRVPPGDYVFEVTAANSDGIWNPVGATLAISVAAPFWRTWWFLGGGAVAGAFLFAAGVRQMSLRRMRRELERLERQNALSRERARIAADMHDEVGSRLTRISLLGELARRAAASPEQCARHLVKLTEQSREVARSLDEIVWAVNPRNDTLEGFAAYIVHYTEEFFEDTPVRCRLDVAPDLPAQPLSGARRHHLFLAFKEALNNVARHSGATEARVRLAIREQWMELTVSDNGRGFTPTGTPGDGLRNMEARLAAIGGEFSLSSDPATGTTIALRIRLTPGEPATPAAPT